MSISYRYLGIDLALAEVAEVKKGNFDLSESLSREDFHLRPFLDETITTDRLIEIRKSFLQLLGVNSVVDLKMKPTDFDRVFTLHCLELFSDLSLIDAFQRDVWSYITLRLLPDLTLWRWPDNDDERFIGGIERSCYQRLWQRAHILGPDLAVGLQEDEALNIFERTLALGSNVPLAKSIARYVVNSRSEASLLNAPKMLNSKIVKVTAQNLRRTVSVQVVQAMNEYELDKLVESVFSQTILALKA